MKEVKGLKIGNVHLEYLENDDDVYFYNPANQRMVHGNRETLTFLKNYHQTNEKVKEVDHFLYGKKKLNPLHLKILQFEMKSQWMDKLVSISQQKQFKYFFITIILIFFIMIPFVFEKAYLYYVTGAYQFKWYHLLYIFLAQILIVQLHEFGHYLTYRKYVRTKTARFGVMIRYFFIPLFYTNVNYMRTLQKKQRIRILLSGVITQLFTGGILSIAYILTENNLILYLYMVNILIIVLNIIPFLRMDGYWLINLFIDSDDYMNSFTQFIFKRKQIQFLELLFAIVNIVLILFVIIIGTVFAYSEMKEIGNWIRNMF